MKTAMEMIVGVQICTISTMITPLMTKVQDSYSMITPEWKLTRGHSRSLLKLARNALVSNQPGANQPHLHDCGYNGRNSSSPSSPPEVGWLHSIRYDQLNRVSYANGLYPIGSGNGKIQNCDSLTGTDYTLGGESTHPTQNPNGWSL